MQTSTPSEDLLPSWLRYVGPSVPNTWPEQSATVLLSLPSIGVLRILLTSDKPYVLRDNDSSGRKDCCLLSKRPIAEFLAQTAMNDLVALEYFFCAKKKTSILSLAATADDPTIRLLYHIVMDKLESERMEELVFLSKLNN